PDVAAGNVMGVSPGAGTDVPRDSTVTITVSLGKEPIKIPANIVGKSVEQATTMLEKAGLTVSGVSGNPARKVKGTDPKVGTEVKPGSSVTLITG
ncbi:MAG TPA: PASTA domain-containing protein, partial [Acidimicrobiales bacterium]